MHSQWRRIFVRVGRAILQTKAQGPEEMQIEPLKDTPRRKTTSVPKSRNLEVSQRETNPLRHSTSYLLFSMYDNQRRTAHWPLLMLPKLPSGVLLQSRRPTPGPVFMRRHVRGSKYESFTGEVVVVIPSPWKKVFLHQLTHHSLIHMVALLTTRPM